jgi:hypothetical protein
VAAGRAGHWIETNQRSGGMSIDNRTLVRGPFFGACGGFLVEIYRALTHHSFSISTIVSGLFIAAGVFIILFPVNLYLATKNK